MTYSLRNRRARRKPIYGVATFAAVIVLGGLLMPERERLRAAGPANTGHEQLNCVQCHTPAEGSVRQQVQANMRHLTGLREVGADFIHKPVVNADCIACHQNNEDRHPAYRFNEPRFAEVRAEIAPQYCVSCHTEHTGRRVTVEATVCSNCHVEMEFQNDPIQPTHGVLAAREEWGSCLRCHDFHGNHVRTTPKVLENGASKDEVARYLSGGGRSIYGRDLRFPALSERATP